MLHNLIKFPIWKNDKISIVKFNDLQKKQIKNFHQKVADGEYNYINNKCLCGNVDLQLDVTISNKDRYGIPCKNLLCKKCGLIRISEKLDNDSTSKFYNNEYRDIYDGEELASASFFEEQKAYGMKFKALVEAHTKKEDILNVFEIGCGAGGILYPFYKEGKKVSGCDFGYKYLKFGISKGLDIYEGEISVLKTPKKSQDLIILSHVLEHINEPIKFINEIAEYINDEKYLLIEVPGIFDIKKSYFNPLLYFQNAHTFNYYEYYLNVFFNSLGFKVIYGDERCTFLLQKPKNWNSKKIISISNENTAIWANKIETELKRLQLLHLLRLNPYYLRNTIGNILEKLGLKKILKKYIIK